VAHAAPIIPYLGINNRFNSTLKLADIATKTTLTFANPEKSSARLTNEDMAKKKMKIEYI